MKKQSVEGKKIVLGVTGGFGTGKTTVSGYCRQFGAGLVDADRIAHNLLRPGSAVYKKIIAAFGRKILKKDRVIDRVKLAQLVFGNRRRLDKLNRIVHPEAVRIIKDKIKLAQEKIVVLDVPLLFEAGLERLVDRVIVVKLDRKSQLGRLLKKTPLSKEDILARIRAQMPLSTKVRRADFVIDNRGRGDRTKKQVRNLLRRVLWKN